MRGNTNSYNVLGSESKILNVVQTGALIREGTVFSGFSGSNYLQLGARVDKGILSLDSSTYIKNFGNVSRKANSWELVTKIHFYRNSSVVQMIVDESLNSYSGFAIVTTDDGTTPNCMLLSLKDYNGTTIISDTRGTYEYLDNTDYWLKLVFTGTQYILSYSLDGENFTTDISITSDKKIGIGTLIFGKSSGNSNWHLQDTTMDIAETYIKINGEYWWRGVEIPNKVSSITDESAIDLLLQQNSAKEALANNLNGLGVTANAKTDSLNQLAYKVSTVSANDVRQKPKGLALNTSTRNGDYDSINHYIVKNGWIFSRNGTSLKYKKLSAMKDKVTTYDSDTATNLSMSTKSPAVPNRENTDWDKEQTIFFNADGSNMYVMNTNTISKYTVQNYNTDTLTFGTAVTLTPKMNNENFNIKWIDINDAETKMLVCDIDGNLVLYDLTGDATQNLTPIFSGETAAIWFFTNNSTDDIFRVYMPDGATYYISFWEFSNNVIGNQIGNTIEVIRSQSNNWRQGILKYKDSNNKYRIFLSSGGINTDDIPSFIMIDCNTRTTTNIFCKLNNAETEVLGNLLTVTLTEVGTYKYLISGMLSAVFDENWNLVGNFINRIKTDLGQNSLQQTLLYDGDIFDFNDNNDSGVIYSAIKHKCWLDKLIAYERTVTVIDQNDNEITKQLIYYPTLTETDLDDGFYNL